MKSTLLLKIEHYVVHGLFFLLIFGLGYWIWPLENKTTSDFTMYLVALALGTVLFNLWKRHWMNRLYSQKDE